MDRTKKLKRGPRIGAHYAVFSLLLSILLLIGATTLVLASDISDALWSGDIRISNNGTAATSVSTNLSLSSPSMIENGYAAADLSDIAVRISGTDTAFMPGCNATSPWIVFVPSIGAALNESYDLYSGNVTGGKIRYFPGDGGMTTIDEADLELGPNFTIEQKGWVNTDTGALKWLMLKSEAFGIRASEAVSGNITAGVLDATDNFTVSVCATGVTKAEHEIKVTANLPCVRFDGDDDILVPGLENEVQNLATGTIEMWARVNSDTAGAFFSVSDVSDANSQWLIYYNNAGNLIYVHCSEAGTGYYNVEFVGAELTLNIWTHLVMVHNGTTPVLYLNGVEKTIGAGEADYTKFLVDVLNIDKAYLGGRETNGGKSLHLLGDISGLRIYNRGLSSNEAKEHFRGIYNNETGLIGCWALDEGTGGTVTDSSVNGNDGTLEGASWVSCPRLRLYIDDILEGTGGIAPIPDNANDWVSLQNNSMPYMEYQKIWVNGILQQHIVWEYDTTFTDLSGKGHDATPTFRATSSDADVSASLVDFGPTEQARLATFTISSEYAILSGNASMPSEMYSELNVSRIPGGAAANEMLAEGGIPQAAWWFPFLYLGICIIGMTVYSATTLGRTGVGDSLREGRIDGSLLMMFVTMEIPLAILGIMEVTPYWPAILFPLPAIAIILSRKHYSWG